MQLKAALGLEDVLLIMEVTETSADYDRTVKIPLYAQAGSPEVWLVGLAREAIEVYRIPRPRDTARFDTTGAANAWLLSPSPRKN